MPCRWGRIKVNNMAERQLDTNCFALSNGGSKGAHASLLRSTMAIILLMAAVASSQTTMATVSTRVTSPGGQCESQFMQGLFDCFNKNSVPFNTYLWIAGDKSGGVPPEDEKTFKKHMCSVEESVVNCTLDVLHSLVGAEFCKDSKGMESLLTFQVHAIFDKYDNYCANECRHTLEKDMRKCYSDYGIDPFLFLPKASDGAILGTSQSSVNMFCINQTNVMSCIKRKADACSESAFVLRRLGLDLERLEGGVKLLCDRKDDYLSSLECFKEPTRGVKKCLEDMGRKLLSLVAKNGTQNRGEVADQFCLSRVEFVQCDLSAWARKNVRECDAAALNLKRDFLCNQLPTMCKQGSMQQVSKEVCEAVPYVTKAESQSGEDTSYIDNAAGMLVGASYPSVFLGFSVILAATFR